MSFDIEKIKSLITVAAQAQVDELELSQSGLDIRVQRYVEVLNASSRRSHEPELGAAIAPAPVHSLVSTEPASTKTGLHILKASMAGTFYRSVNPDAGPLVNVGDSVNAGTVVGVLESMKIINEIESELSGRIKRVLCDNGDLVSAGQPLFEIEEC